MSARPEISLRGDVRAVIEGRPHGVLVSTDRLRGTVTYALPGSVGPGQTVEPLIVRVASRPGAEKTVEREARLLVELRRMRMGPIEKTIPRHVGTVQLEGLLGAMSSTVPGVPMRGDERTALHAVQPWLVRRNFRYAAEWLSSVQDASAGGPSRIDWATQVAEATHDRWRGHRLLPAVLSHLHQAGERLEEFSVRRTAVHGDFWHGNILIDEQQAGVSGVLNWADGDAAGWPLRDLLRFALRYSDALGPSNATRRRMTGRARSGSAGGVISTRRAPFGSGWYPAIVRAYLRQGLEGLGLPAVLWYEAALVGVAEIAAHAGETERAESYLTLLASLPGHLS